VAFRTIEVALRANTAAFTAQMGAAAAQVRSFGGQIETTVAKNSRDFEKLGKVGVVIGAAFVASAALAVKAAINYESAFAGVAKTVDGTAQQMAQLADGIRGMARELPASTTEIAAVAEAAGALGVKREDILGFTRVMVDLGETTNLTADEAATSLAQLMNIMGTAGADVDRLGSTLVDLGNNGASTEKEILELGQRLAGAGKLAGLSEAEVLGFANALASMGIEAEAGGTAFSRVFVRINDAVIDGSDKLGVFADVAGMSAEQFQRAYEQDAAGAIVSFVEGLGRMQASGQSTTSVLEDLELGEIRVSDALRRVGGNADVLTASLDQGRLAWGENAALAEEAEKRYATTGAQLEILRNNVVDLAIGFGDRLLPAVRFMASGTKDLIQGFQDMPGPMQGVVAVGGSLVGILSGAAGVALVFGDRIRGGIAALRAFDAAFPRTSHAIGTWMIGLSVAGAAIGLLASAMGKARAEADAMVASLNEKIDRSSYEGVAAGLDTIRIRMAEINEDLPRGFGMVGAALKSALEVLSPLENTVLDNEAAFRALVAAEEELAVAGVHLSENTGQLMTNLNLTREEVENLARKAGIDLTGAYHEVVPALEAAHSEMTTGLTTSDKVRLSLEEQEEAAKALEDTYKALAESLGAFTDPMQAYQSVLSRNEEAARTHAQAIADSTDDAEDSWEDYAKGATVSLGEFAAELEKQIAAQDQWATNLMVIAGRGREDVARELAKMGPEGAALVAEFASAGEAEMNRAGDFLVESARRGVTDAGQAMDTELKVMAEIARQGASGTVQSVAEALDGLPGATEDTIRDAARRANVALAEARPEWNRQWLDRSDTARREMAGVSRDVPPVAAAAAEGANQEVARRSPLWTGTWSGYYARAKGSADAMRRDVPPVVGFAGDAMSGALNQRLPGFQNAVGGYAGALESGIRTVNVSAGASWANVPEAVRREFKGRADGAVVDYFASGGFKEKHVAEIARAGDWRVWAEPETGGEAYIPLSPGKRGRSVPIWLETGRRLGLDEDSLDALRGVMSFHDGGLWRVPSAPGLPDYGPPIRPRGEATMQNMEALARAVAEAHMKLPHHTVPQLTGGIGYQAMMAALRVRFPGLALISGFRPGAITATGNPSYHGMGRAVDIPPRLDVNRWIYDNYKAQTRELIFSQPGAKQIKNGSDYFFTGITRAMHFDHNHWAMALGGLLDGFNGLRSYDRGGYLNPGYTLAHNGTGHPEMVVPSGGSSGPTTTVHLTIRNEITVDGELGPSSRRELERMQRENNAEIVAMVRQGVR
jgi:TP901 family phage tail tape measure protein